MKIVLGREGRLNFWPAYVDVMIIVAFLALAAAIIAQGTIELPKPRQIADQVIREIKEELNKSDIKVEIKADGLILPESLLKFESGEIEPVADEDTKNLFKKICSALKKSFGKNSNAIEHLYIQVEGHTDSQPIGPSIAEYYPTNWELSAARATNILRKMMFNYDMSPNKYQMRAIGLADTKPIERKKKSTLNRRIEIKILPNYEKLSEKFGIQ